MHMLFLKEDFNFAARRVLWKVNDQRTCHASGVLQRVHTHVLQPATHH